MFQGIDVSKWQGKIDWQAVKNHGVDFAMIRAGYGMYENQVDTRFAENVQNAQRAGISVGTYWYSYATTIEEIQKEAQVFLKIIEPYSFEYPICLDIEDSCQHTIGRTMLTDMAIAFLNAIENAGYFAMIYASKSWFDDRLDDSRLIRYAHWVAQWTDTPTYTGAIGIWQYTSKGMINGIARNVDCNHCYVNYPNIIEKNGLNRFEKTSQIAPGDVVAISGCGYASCDGSGGKTKVFEQKKMKIISVRKGRFPYACSINLNAQIGDMSQTTGWFAL